MRLLTPVAPRWYVRLNEATVVTSLMIVLGYLLIEVAFTNLRAELPIQINATAASIALAAVLYGLVGFRLLVRKSSLSAGLVSYLFLVASIGTLVSATGGFESQYLLLWVMVIMFSAMFGWLVFFLIWSITHAYFTLLALGIIGASPNPGLLVAYLITIELPFIISFFLWYGQGVAVDQETQEGEVDAKDISPKMLINSIAEGVVVIDEDKRIQVFNPAAANVTGWSQEDAKGIDYHSVMLLVDDKGNQLSQNKDPIAQVFSKGETVVNNDVILQTRNNKHIELSLVASPIKDKNGGVVAVVAVFRDVSEERSQERQRAEFISTASHEMRTPVAAIEGYLALAMNNNVSKIDSKAREYLEKAHASTQHLGKLFQDLLTAAKSEDGRLKNTPEVVELGKFLDELVEDVKFVAQKKGLVLEYNGGVNNQVKGSPALRPLYYAYIDPERMREVITNLFDNAVKYTDEGKITVSLEADDHYITISVTDTGPGIPQEDIPHLFQKFYRVDNSITRQIGGTGLGLFIARKIVEMNNGTIGVESEVGKGSRFYVKLPRLSKEKADTLLKEQAGKDTPLANVTTNLEL